MLDLDLTLKNNELFLAGRPDERGGMREAGMYLRDTRFLSAFAMAVSGVPLDVLSVQTLSASEAMVTSTTQSGHEDRTGISGSDFMVRAWVTLDSAMNVTFEVQSFGARASTVTLDILLAADFRDMFDVRGMTPKHRPRLQPPRIRPDQTVSFSAIGGDGKTARLDITSTPSPGVAGMANADGTPGNEMVPVTLSFPIDLANGSAGSVRLSLLPVPVGPDHDPHDALETRLDIETDDPDLEAMCLRADLDLAMLQTTFPEGNMPAAGIPWFIAPFGRDSLIVALQTIHVYPERVWSTLQVLAANQGSKIDEFREEEPGKILHEIRYGDMARTHQIPHTPYFGSIDSTPLFVMTFADAYRQRQDEGMYDVLIPHVRRALAWIEEYGDLDGDGLVEFGTKSDDGVHITQQGWKDSGDSLHFANGDPVEGPIALVEVQGYVYAAYAWMAGVATTRGDETWAAELCLKADRVRTAVEEQFWLEEEQYYAQALDGRKQVVDAISSNPGHLLFCGLPSPERAALVVDRLMRDDMLTRWGIRTLSGTMAAYNPMSYHKGSIWPHDNSLAMSGMKSYGFDGAAARIAECLIRLSAHDPERRLSELYCGFDRDDDRLGPVNYPVSCRPQAWAAGCAHLLVRTMFGPHQPSDGNP